MSDQKTPEFTHNIQETNMLLLSKQTGNVPAIYDVSILYSVQEYEISFYYPIYIKKNALYVILNHLSIRLKMYFDLTLKKNPKPQSHSATELLKYLSVQGGVGATLIKTILMSNLFLPFIFSHAPKKVRGSPIKTINLLYTCKSRKNI